MAPTINLGPWGKVKGSRGARGGATMASMTTAHDDGRPRHDDHHRVPRGHGGHSHGIVDPSIASSGRGLWALKWSFLALTLTAALQLAVVVVSGSVGLLADTIHNFADAATAIPLGVAFWLARRGVTPRFTYGLGRVEDLAGVAIILTIFASAGLAAWASIVRLLHPQPVEALGAVMGASLVGFIGNEAVAVFRVRVGRQIGSAALVADGQHARVDGWTSLAVLAGALGVWAGYPLADPLVGLIISVAIFGVVWQAAREIVVRILDGVDPGIVGAVTHAARHVAGVEDVTETRARWIGHRLHVELNVTVHRGLTVAEGHDVAIEVRHQLLHHLPHLGSVTVHVDPEGSGGDRHHQIVGHAHDGLPPHSHL
jgi:cation diffusion facilitator family transporter